MSDDSQEKIGRPAGRSKFKHFMGKVPCLVGYHHRSKKRASRTPDDQGRYTSVCTFCEVPMERIGDGKWKVSRRSR
jgi:hypothetical protein